MSESYTFLVADEHDSGITSVGSIESTDVSLTTQKDGCSSGSREHDLFFCDDLVHFFVGFLPGIRHFLLGVGLKESLEDVVKFGFDSFYDLPSAMSIIDTKITTRRIASE